jgi:hypothetical protein
LMFLVYRWRSSMLSYAPYFKTWRRSQLPFINLGAKQCCHLPVNIWTKEKSAGKSMAQPVQCPLYNCITASQGYHCTTLFTQLGLTVHVALEIERTLCAALMIERMLCAAPHFPGHFCLLLKLRQIVIQILGMAPPNVCGYLAIRRPL